MQKIIPAILEIDPAELQRKLALFKDSCRWVHIDIMDGTFVPGMTANISELGEVSEFFNLEIHLMVKNPERYLSDCASVLAKRVYIHYEATENLGQTLSAMEKYSFQKGVVLNLETQTVLLAPYKENIGAVLCMAIIPGAQGREFMPEVLQKVKEVRVMSSRWIVGVDGGINKNDVCGVFSAGGDYAIVGSGIWTKQDPVVALRELEEMVE